MPFAMFIVERAFASRTSDLHLFIMFANRNCLTVVVDMRKPGFADTPLVTTGITVRSATRTFIALCLMDFIFTTFFNGLALVPDRNGSWLAYANLTTSFSAILGIC